jgi:hypothetical protein
LKLLLEALGEEILADLDSTPWPAPEGRRLLPASHLAFEGAALTVGGPQGIGPRILLGSLEVREPAQVVLVGPHVLNWRRCDRLDDPRCIERMVENIVVMADAFHRRQLADAEATDDPVALQGAIALKAFLLGFDATRAGERAATAAAADEYLYLLEAEPPDAPPTIIRKGFYALLAATCRPEEREAERRAAELGMGFARFGGYSPLFPWLRIVREVRSASGSPVRRLRTGRDDAAAERLRRVAHAASRLAPARLEALDYYLRCTTLDDLAIYHGIL